MDGIFTSDDVAFNINYANVDSDNNGGNDNDYNSPANFPCCTFDEIEAVKKSCPQKQEQNHFFHLLVYQNSQELLVNKFFISTDLPSLLPDSENKETKTSCLSSSFISHSHHNPNQLVGWCKKLNIMKNMLLLSYNKYLIAQKNNDSDNQASFSSDADADAVAEEILYKNYLDAFLEVSRNLQMYKSELEKFIKVIRDTTVNINIMHTNAERVQENNENLEKIIQECNSLTSPTSLSHDILMTAIPRLLSVSLKLTFHH